MFVVWYKVLMSKNINKLQLVLRKYDEKNIDETVVGFTLATANRNIGRKNFDESHRKSLSIWSIFPLSKNLHHAVNL